MAALALTRTLLVRRMNVASLSPPVLTLLLLRLVLPLLCRNAGCTSRGGGIDHRRHAQFVTQIPLMPSPLPLTYLSSFCFDSGTALKTSDTHASVPAVRPRARDTSTLKYFGVKFTSGGGDKSATMPQSLESTLQALDAVA